MTSLLLAMIMAIANDQITCKGVLEDVDRYGVDPVVEQLRVSGPAKAPGLLRCLIRKEAPAPLIQALRAGAGDGPDASTTSPTEVDITDPGWPSKLGGVIAHRALVRYPTPLPLALYIDQDRDALPDWYWGKMDAIARAVLGGLPPESTGAEHPSALGEEGAAELLGRETADEARRKLRREGFRRTLLLTLSPYEEDGLQVDFEVRDLDHGERRTGFATFVPKRESPDAALVREFHRTRRDHRVASTVTAVGYGLSGALGLTAASQAFRASSQYSLARDINDPTRGQQYYAYLDDAERAQKTAVGLAIGAGSVLTATLFHHILVTRVHRRRVSAARAAATNQARTTMATE